MQKEGTTNQNSNRAFVLPWNLASSCGKMTMDPIVSNMGKDQTCFYIFFMSDFFEKLLKYNKPWIWIYCCLILVANTFSFQWLTNNPSSARLATTPSAQPLNAVNVTRLKRNTRTRTVPRIVRSVLGERLTLRGQLAKVRARSRHHNFSKSTFC